MNKNYVCTQCGGDICLDHEAIWNVEDQAWEMGSDTGNSPFCRECGHEESLLDCKVEIPRTLADTFADLSADMRRASEIMDGKNALGLSMELDPLLQNILDQIAAFEWAGKKRFSITQQGKTL